MSGSPVDTAAPSIPDRNDFSAYDAGDTPESDVDDNGGAIDGAGAKATWEKHLCVNRGCIARRRRVVARTR